MSTIDRETIHLGATESTRKQFEEGAKRLNLSPEAYFAYLVGRMHVSGEVDRFDRHVRDVFGKHGELMRRLAK
jgi:hypothetical protein